LESIAASDSKVTFSGTQVTINSTNTYVVDPVIEIGGGIDGARFDSRISRPDTSIGRVGRPVYDESQGACRIIYRRYAAVPFLRFDYERCRPCSRRGSS
jgi:hypothetical protein